MSSVYLSGPSYREEKDPSVPIQADWKTYATGMFLQSGIIVANPLELDLTGFLDVTNEETNLSTVKHSLNLIDRADSLLANLSKISESATMEIFYAHGQGKHVVVVGNEPFSPWVSLHSNARFQRLKEALEYVVSRPSSLDTVTWACQFESNLNKRSEQYPPIGKEDFEYYGGSIPVLVLAPHATSYFKDGSLFSSESHTGSLAVLLHKLTGCHALISSYCTVADPVVYLNSPYVNFLSAITKKIDVKMIIALHGIDDWNYPNDIIVSSWNKDSLINKAEYLNLLISMLKIKDFKEIGFDSPDLIRNEIKTLSKLIFEDLTIPTLRLDIHKRYRLPQMHADSYKNLLTSLAQFVMIVN